MKGSFIGMAAGGVLSFFGVGMNSFILTVGGLTCIILAISTLLIETNDV